MSTHLKNSDIQTIGLHLLSKLSLYKEHDLGESKDHRHLLLSLGFLELIKKVMRRHTKKVLPQRYAWCTLRNLTIGFKEGK
jgi:hypothetical protein